MTPTRGPVAPSGRATEARRLALTVLHAIDDGGAFANLALDTALEDSRLSGPDRSLVTELVYGVTRWRGRLDYVLDRLSTTPVSELPVRIRNTLRMGLYQLMFLDRVPARAAVSESVALAREFGHRGTAGLANAVLRRAARSDTLACLPPPGDPGVRLAIEFSHPEWLVRRWLARYGAQETSRLCRVDNEGAPLTLRVNTTRTGRDELAARLGFEGVRTQPGRLFPEALVAVTKRPLRELATYGEGLFSVQDESSMAAARVVRPKTGESVLDACAGVGGKSTHLAELAGDAGRVVAVDVFAHKLRLLETTARRLGLCSIEIRRADTRVLPSTGLAGTFDAVLVDAPCSGSGVLRRRPDLRWRVKEEALTNLVRLQEALLEAGAECVRPGGVVVYSTCSMEPEENQKVVEGFLSRRREFEKDDAVTAAGLRGAGSTVQDGCYLTLAPVSGGSDGFFVARMIRRAKAKGLGGKYEG